MPDRYYIVECDYAKLRGAGKARESRAAAVLAECERRNSDERAWERAA